MPSRESWMSMPWQPTRRYDLIAPFIGLELEEVLQIRGYINRFYQRESGVPGTTEAGARAFPKLMANILG